VIVTVQVPVESRVQLASTVPTVVSDDTKFTVPDGIFEAVVVSTTVTLQEPVRPAVSEAGQDTVVEVSSLAGLVTLILAEVPELPL
jgi:hypothetical protein